MWSPVHIYGLYLTIKIEIFLLNNSLHHVHQEQTIVEQKNIFLGWDKGHIYGASHLFYFTKKPSRNNLNIRIVDILAIDADRPGLKGRNEWKNLTLAFIQHFNKPTTLLYFSENQHTF